MINEKLRNTIIICSGTPYKLPCIISSILIIRQVLPRNNSTILANICWQRFFDFIISIEKMKNYNEKFKKFFLKSFRKLRFVHCPKTQHDCKLGIYHSLLIQSLTMLLPGYSTVKFTFEKSGLKVRSEYPCLKLNF